MDANLLDLQEIENLAKDKEEQWRSAATLQIKSLHAALSTKTQLHDELEMKFFQLKTDFKYNLKLLQERDLELKSLDTIQQVLKANESKYLAELSDFHIKTDNLKAKLQRENEAKREMESHYKQMLIDQQTQLEIFRTSKSKELEELISDFQKTKLQLEQENNGLKFQIESQKLDLINEMEEVMKMKEKEQRQLKDENHNQQVFLEMKNKLLSKELDVCRSKEGGHLGAVDDAKKKVDQLQGELQKAKWDLSDASSMKNSRILELEAKVKQLESSSESIEKEFSGRSMQLDKEIRRREANLVASKQTLIDREMRFQEEIRTLEGRLETSKSEINRALWDRNNVKAEMEDELSRCKMEISNLREKLEDCTLAKSQSLVSRDTEIISLKKREDILKDEIKTLKVDMERYRNDLVKSAKREELLERNVKQMKLDFQRKYEDAECEAYVKTEDFASNLLKSRDHAVAEKERIQTEFKDFKRIHSGVDFRAKVALSLLQRHRLLQEYETELSGAKKGPTTPPFAWPPQMDLVEQNKQLKDVIKQMTSDMEELHKLKQSSSGSIDGKYVESVEREVIELKNEKRRLLETIQTLHDGVKADVDGKEASNQQIEISKNHPKIQQHINTLNNKIGNLEGEKLDLRAQLQKLQVKFEHQLMLNQQHEQESNSLSSKLQQFELESTATKHRSEQEIKRLKNEISNLSLQLVESRREADEYYRGGIKNNLRAMELSDKVSQLTVGMAADTPWLASHAQAKLVQDLQDNISQLQRRLAREKKSSILHDPPAGSGSTRLLRVKLHSAGDRIRALTQEKSMLLESSNRMRAELSSMKKDDDEGPSLPPEDGGGEGRMNKMEQLQYDLTKKQLAFAQRQTPSSVESSKSSQEDTDKELPEPPTRDDVTRLHPTSTPRRFTDPVMMSSIDDASIKDVWKVLEQEPSSPSIAGDQRAIFADRTKEKGKIPTTLKVNKRKKKAKIRNYNIKDDS